MIKQGCLTYIKTLTRDGQRTKKNTSSRDAGSTFNYAWPLIVKGSMRSSSEYGVNDRGL
jgi:hypothetical protein